MKIYKFPLGIEGEVVTYKGKFGKILNTGMSIGNPVVWVEVDKDNYEKKKEPEAELEKPQIGINFGVVQDEIMNEENKELLSRPQIDCYLTYTNEETHKEIRSNIHRSPLFNGNIEGVGPRYCPSIEDKVMRFADKERHQIFIEPMGLDTEEMYIQGFSTSLPTDVQYDMLLAVSAVGSWSSGIFSAMSGVNDHRPEPYILSIDPHKTERQQQNH